MNLTNEKITKQERKYFSRDLNVVEWETLEAEFKQLKNEQINSPEELLILMEKKGELNDILSEEIAWRYINMTRFADDDSYEKAYNDFYANIISRTKPYEFALKKKFYDSPFRKHLDPGKYDHLNKIIANEIEMYREENIPLQTKEQELSMKYGSINSGMTVTYDGEEKTLSQLSIYLKDKDRKVREEVWKLKLDKISQYRDELNKLFDEMKELRIQIARNAGFDNYRDYMHKSMGRFSYTPQDIEKFHAAVEKVVLPFLKETIQERKNKLGLDNVRPWDTAVDLDGKVLKPFETQEQFINTAIDILQEIKPEFGMKLNKMKNSDLLDLENRKGKAPGGYNYGLQETGAPFIFMNAVGLHRDIVTLLHEGGHAMHSFAMVGQKLDPYKEIPSEVAELASIGMEFLTMDLWNKYYPLQADYNKARKDQLEDALSFLPWCMIVDAFQQWIYTHPQHSWEERDEYFASLMDRFSTGVDWTGLEDFKKILWLFQLHIFEVPFYYIEYGISQLGALAIYRNLKKNGKEKTLVEYENFLKLAYSKPADKLYEAAGIKFNFSEEYLSELVELVREELAKI